MSMAGSGGSMVGGVSAGGLSGDAILKAFADPEGLKAFAAKAQQMAADAETEATAIRERAKADASKAAADAEGMKAKAVEAIESAKKEAGSLVAAAQANVDALVLQAKTEATRLAGLKRDVKAMEAKAANLADVVQAAFDERERVVAAREARVGDAEQAAAQVRIAAEAAEAAARETKAEYEQKVAAFKSLIGG